MSRRIALVLGNGNYVLKLCAAVRGNLSDPVSIVSVFPEDETPLAALDVDHFFDLREAEDFYRHLRRDGITHVVFGGNFRLTENYGQDLSSVILGLIKSFGEQTSELATLRVPLAALLDLFTRSMSAAGFEPILASELVPDFKPGKGVLAGIISADEQALLNSYAVKARKELEDQPLKSVRQAVVFDGDRGHTSIQGTEALLRRLEGIPKSHNPRILVKICPPNYDFRMDPPVIGPKTIEAARRAEVDVIVIEGDAGIIVDREDTIAAADQARIRIFAI